MDDNRLRDAILEMRRLNSDTDIFEAKACGKRLSSDVWESVSAFANTAGGVLVLGLSQELGFRPEPGFDSEKTLNQFVSGIGDADREGVRVANPPKYTTSIHLFEDAELLVIEIEENPISQKPCYIEARGIKAGSFKRVWDKDIVLSATELYEIQNMFVRTGADREIVATRSDLDDNLVEELLARKEGTRALKGTSGEQEKLTRLGVMDSEGGVTLAGLLALGVYPQQFFPKLLVDVAVFPENDKGAHGVPRFLDRVLCEGAAVEIINDAVEAVARNLRRVSVVAGTGRTEELEIPREVLREAIANAVVHREYDKRFIGQSVNVEVYPNRIEISSPGGLWGTRTKENLAEGVSECRNDLLMSLIEGIPLQGRNVKVAEGNGTGVPFMINEMKAHALGGPEFLIKFDRFTVRLGRYGTEILENKQWIAAHVGERLDKDAETVLLLLRSYGKLSVKEIHEKLGMDSDDVRMIVDRLAQNDLVIGAGAGKFAFNSMDKGARKRLDGLKPAVKELYTLLDESEAKSTRELAAEMGKNERTIQRYLKELIERHLAEPTASSWSKERRYLRTRD